MVGIVAYGAYVPRLRLNRQAVYDANKWFAAGLRGLAKGERSMANWDEDSITMAVEASRDCLTSHKAEDVRNIYFASTTHPFKDRQNAGVIGTALNVEQNLSATDVGGSLKAGTSALMAGLNAAKGSGPSLVAAADKRMGRVASANELNYGDGAAALLCGTENVIAKLVGHHSVSMDFVDHFRGEDVEFDYGWEERWIRDEGYSKIVPPAIKAALVACKLKGSDDGDRQMVKILTAAPVDGLDALEALEREEGAVDLVVSDVVMPEMDGPTMLTEMRKRNPDLRIIFVSGYAEDAFEKSLPEGQQFNFLPKPFTLSQLVAAVKETMTAAS